jgi:hypothetical protein
MTASPHPFDLIFASLAEEHFPAIRDALAGARNIDAFLLARPAVDLLHDLRPDEGYGDAVDDLVALLHAAYLFWTDGLHTQHLDAANTGKLCAPAAREAPSRNRPMPGMTTYVQIAPRLVWGRLVDEETFEPLDGWFATPVAGALHLVACFGVHPDRPGLTVVTVAGARPELTRRADGSASFQPTMPGGNAAGLFAVDAPSELLLLAWRAADLAEDME